MPPDIYRMNRGFRVNQARAGKKCMGITMPGKSSGVSILVGNLKAMGVSRLTKLRVANRRLKTISPLSFSHLFRAQKPMAANTPPARLEATMRMEDATLEKSA